MISAHAFEASGQWYVSSRLALFHWNGTIKVKSIVQGAAKKVIPYRILQIFKQPR